MVCAGLLLLHSQPGLPAGDDLPEHPTHLHSSYLHTSVLPMLQALGDQAFIILAQSMSHGKGFTASFSISLWALARLSWSPTLPQAQMLVRLLAHTLSSDSLNLRHAAILVFSLGHLKLRPPQPMMQHLMDRLAAGLEGAGLSEVLQVLTGCRCLGWRISKSWWAQLYRNGFGALQQGNAGAVVCAYVRTGALVHADNSCSPCICTVCNLGQVLSVVLGAL